MKKSEFTIWERIEKGVISGLEKTRKELKKELALNTPVDTGYLRDGACFGSGEGNEIKRKGFTLTIKNEAFYAPAVYYGTGGMKGRPWIEEAIERIDVREIIQEAVGDGIKK